MKNDPVLVIMAAGMGSRYGGLKQMDPVDEYGNILMDFSIFDAYRAGFRDVAFIIKHEFEDAFKRAVGARTEKFMRVNYVFQDINDLPDGFSVPIGRVKPWGTSHAVLACEGIVNGPFIAINADDYYGPEAFRLSYNFLTAEHGENAHALVAYQLENTLTDNGSVSRGVCEVDENGYLKSVVERLKVFRRKDGGAEYTEDGTTFIPIPAGRPASMNFWCFHPGIFRNLKNDFNAFLTNIMPQNPLKSEYLLPTEVQRIISAGRATVKVLYTKDRWFGMTYPEDKPAVTAELQTLKAKGVYPERLNA